MDQYHIITCMIEPSTSHALQGPLVCICKHSIIVTLANYMNWQGDVALPKTYKTDWLHALACHELNEGYIIKAEQQLSIGISTQFKMSKDTINMYSWDSQIGANIQLANTKHMLPYGRASLLSSGIAYIQYTHR